MQYSTNEGATITSWFPVNQITSITKAVENKREKQIATSTKVKQHKKTTTNMSKNDGKSAIIPHEQAMLALNEHLQAWDLAPVETAKDGNCFFSVVSQMIYSTDEYHHLIRIQALEHLLDNPLDYLTFLSNDESFSDYIEYMSNDGVWTDAPIIRAMADAMDIEIIVITNGEYIPAFMPSSGNPIETIFIGNIIDYHLMAMVPQREAQQIPYGGRTSDGVNIEYSGCFDVAMTWLYNQLFQEL